MWIILLSFIFLASKCPRFILLLLTGSSFYCFPVLETSSGLHCQPKSFLTVADISLFLILEQQEARSLTQLFDVKKSEA